MLKPTKLTIWETEELGHYQNLSKTEVAFERTGEEKGMVPIWVPFKQVLVAVKASRLKSPTLVVAVLSLAAKRNQNG
jgi:hypothetical protein